MLLKDFVFNDQDDFFTMPENLKIPLNFSNIQGNIPNLPENLSLIEELTKHSSSATNKSEEVTPRNNLNNPEKEIKHSNLITSKEPKSSNPKKNDPNPILSSRIEQRPKILSNNSLNGKINSPRGKSYKMNKV